MGKEEDDGMWFARSFNPPIVQKWVTETIFLLFGMFRVLLTNLDCHSSLNKAKKAKTNVPWGSINSLFKWFLFLN